MASDGVLVTSLAIAQDLRGRGFAPVRVEPRGKKPIEPAWQTLIYTDEDLPNVFRSNENVGILLGTPSDNTVDLDIDHGRGAAILDAIGRPKTLSYHHNGRPHLLFRCSTVPKTTKFEGTRSGKKLMFIEVRSTGAQSVAPGSIHPESGKRYEWENNEPRAEWDDFEVVHFGRELATACLLSDHWLAPGRGESGARHYLALAVAGFLGRRTDRATVERIVMSVCMVMHDRERHDRLRAVADTMTKIVQGIPVVGLPALSELIGEDDTRTLAKWWPETLDSQHAPTINFALPATPLNGTAAPLDARPSPAYIPEAVPETTPFLRPISDLLAMNEEEPDWLIKDLFTAGSSGWVGAEPKVGKSWTVLEIIYALSTGTSFLGRFDVPERRKVVYIQEEDSLQRVLRRFKRILHGTPGRGIPEDDYLRWSVRVGFKIDAPQWIMNLRAELDSYKADVVILDVFNRFHAKNENDQAEMSALLETLTVLTREYGCAFIVVHHNKKAQAGLEMRPNQMLRGSGVLSGWSECSIYLRKGKQKNTFIIVPESKDAPEMDDFSVTLVDTENGGIQLQVGDVTIADRLADTQAKIVKAIDALADEGLDATTMRIADRVGVDRSTVSKYLRDLVESGIVGEDEVKMGRTYAKLYFRPTAE